MEKNSVMSFLSPENQAALAERLQQMDNSEPTETTQEVVEVQETQETQAETAPSEEVGTERDVNVAEDSSPSDENSIPYSRFKSVIESRNEFKSKVSDLERQLEELRAAQENKTTEETQEDDLFGYLDDAYEEDPKYSELEKRLEKFEMYQAEVDLQKEISMTKQAFPNVPEEVLLNAVIHDADADLMEIAHKYDMFVDNIRKEALKGYTPAASQPVETPSAPRRVSPAGAAGATFDASVNKPKNMDDAKASFMDYLRQNWK